MKFVKFEFIKIFEDKNFFLNHALLVSKTSKIYDLLQKCKL